MFHNNSSKCSGKFREDFSGRCSGNSREIPGFFWKVLRKFHEMSRRFPEMLLELSGKLPQIVGKIRMLFGYFLVSMSLLDFNSRPPARCPGDSDKGVPLRSAAADTRAPLPGSLITDPEGTVCPCGVGGASGDGHSGYSTLPEPRWLLVAVTSTAGRG